MSKVDATRVAQALYHDKHPAIAENLLSTLLAAALNESREFRRWLMTKAEVPDKYRPGAFRASAGLRLTRLFAGNLPTQKGDYKFSDLALYRRADVRETEWLILSTVA